MKIWLQIACLTLALAAAGCGSSQRIAESYSAYDRQRWNKVMVDEPSAESTNMGIWVSMNGGG